MVRFEEDKFVVEIEAGPSARFAVEEWLDLQRGLINAMRAWAMNDDLAKENFYTLANLLEALQPTCEDAIKMVE